LNPPKSTKHQIFHSPVLGTQFPSDLACCFAFPGPVALVPRLEISSAFFSSARELAVIRHNERRMQRCIFAK
ncbi:hypothetical protein T265_16146, partial [Opisthorchis viverrini]